MTDQTNLPGEAHCSTCSTTAGLRRFERVTGGGWTCIPCVRKAQGLPPRLAEGESHFHVALLPCDDCGSGLGVYVTATDQQMRWVRCGNCGSTNMSVPRMPGIDS